MSSIIKSNYILNTLDGQIVQMVTQEMIEVAEKVAAIILQEKGFEQCETIKNLTINELLITFIQFVEIGKKTEVAGKVATLRAHYTRLGKTLDSELIQKYVRLSGHSLTLGEPVTTIKIG